MNHLFRFIKGYLKVSISGSYIERFFNLCMLQNIILWNVTNESDKEKVLYISLSDFFCIKPLLKKTKVKVKILKKYGFPFWKQKIIKRKIYICGLLFCLMILFYLSNFIWSIQLSGNTELTQSNLEKFLNQNNLGYGIAKKQINCKEIEKILRKKYPYISWVSVTIEGTTLNICVKELSANHTVKTKPEFQIPTDIVASESGIITAMVVRSGVPQKNVGDKVQKGEILISGNLPIYEDDGTIRTYHYCQSDGDVYIKKTLSFSKSFEKKQNKLLPDEKSRCIYWLKFGNLLLEPNMVKEPNITYEITSNSHQLCLFSNFYLPVYYGKKEYFPLKNKKIIYTDEYAKQALKKAYSYYEERLQEKGVQIIQKNVKIKQGMSINTLEANLTVKIPITLQKKAIPQTISLQEEQSVE